MPAVVSRTDGSCSAGTSEPEAMRLWSRLSKKVRKRSRISSDVTRLSLGCARCESPRAASSTRTAGCASTRTAPSCPTAPPASTAGSRNRRPRSSCALEADAVWLVQQFRHPVGERFWEFPQGAWEDAPDADAEALARGELAEETGLRAARLEHLGRLYFAYGLSDQYVDVWRATGLEPGAQALEPTEYGLVARRFERTEVERMIRDNEIRDAASVAAWHLAS